ncbi:unnamed protein product [Cuscuta epithymum]|uniref:Uncharacterized protein n=1 Tax=Cuscuta epithymum TaxID=186058 RepID=A0AAV0F3C6_9ASTE|nr:unnamed protein product [Cuscuta epithymum]
MVPSSVEGKSCVIIIIIHIVLLLGISGLLGGLALNKLKHHRDVVGNLSGFAAFSLGVSYLLTVILALWFWCYKISEETRTATRRLTLATMLFLFLTTAVSTVGEIMLVKVKKGSKNSVGPSGASGISDHMLKTYLIVVVCCCSFQGIYALASFFDISCIRGAVFDSDYTRHGQ